MNKYRPTPERSNDPEKNSTPVLKIVACILLLAEVLCLAYLLFMLKTRADVLPTKYFLLLAGGCVVLAAGGLALIGIGQKAWKARCIISIVISGIVLAVGILGIVYVNRLYDTLEQVNTDKATVSAEMNIYVRKDDGLKTMEDLKGLTIGVPEHMDEELTAAALDQLESTLGITIIEAAADKDTDTETADKAEDTETADKDTDTEAADKDTDTKAADKDTDTEAADKDTDTKAADKAADTETADKAADTETADKDTDTEIADDSVQVQSVAGLYALSENLKEGGIDAVLIKAAHEEVLKAGDEDFDDWAVLLGTLTVEAEISVEDAANAAAEDAAAAEEAAADKAAAEQEAAEEAAEKEAAEAAKKAEAEKATKTPTPTPTPEAVEPQDAFIMYINGMDTRGDQIIAESGNSDVNILAVVNPKTKRVLLISTPRDFYYYLWGDTNYPDKLTHSGYYGIDCGMSTIGAIYDVNVDYYTRVGFNSVINIVDALGGVTVNSEYEFELFGYTFHVGENEVNGEAALAFCRERKSLPGGDRARGINQEALITAVLNKVLAIRTPEELQNVLEAVVANVATNYPVEYMNNLIKLQLAEPGGWTIESIQADGTGGWDYCYSLGSENDVMYPDWSTVEAAKTKIAEVLAGE